MNRIRHFHSEAEQRATAEIATAVAAIEAGKIAPSSRDHHSAACRTEGGLASFKAMVDASAVIAGKTDLDGKNSDKAAATALTSRTTTSASMRRCFRKWAIAPINSLTI